MSARGLLLGLALAAAPAASAEADRSYFAVPGVAYLDGVGPIYGGAAGLKNAFADGTTLAAFKTFGKVEGGGLALGGLRVFDGRGRLHAAAGVLQRGELTTQYGRGYEQRFLVDQVMDGFGLATGVTFDPVPGRLSWNLGYSFSSLGFVAYKNRAGQTIPISRKDLHDINTNALTVGVAASPFGGDPETLVLKESLTLIAGRAAQSDMALFKTGLSGRKRLGGMRLSYTAQAANALVVRDAGPGALDGRCGAVADPALRRECQLLEAQITAFVVKSNSAGTSLPLGGSRALRSYREARFKAAHTGLAGLEWGWTPVSGIPVELVAFYELGFANDNAAALLTRGRYSAGTGLRATVARLQIRAEFAYGLEGGAAFLTAGAPW